MIKCSCNILINQFYTCNHELVVHKMYNCFGAANHRFNSNITNESTGAIIAGSVIYVIDNDCKITHLNKYHYIQIFSNVYPHVGWIMLLDDEYLALKTVSPEFNT